MRPIIPEPLVLPWDLMANPSAKSGVDTLADGRKRFWVEEVLAGITPAMLKWWFAHLDGDMDIDGRQVPRYRVWHPRDHVYATYVRRCSDGSMGPGAQIANLEFLGRNPRYRVQVVATVERLDEEVFVHNIDVAGLHVARMEHTFDATPGGTRFGHFFIVPGAPIPLLERIVPWWFSEEKGRAWLKHAVEEMGNLPNFLPRLYEQDAGELTRGSTAPKPGGE